MRASLLPLSVLLSLSAGCAESALYKAGSDQAAESGGYWDTGGLGGESDDADGEPQDTYAPESEDDYLKLAPAATNVYVFVANPSRNTVTRVSVPSLEVITTEVGVDPEAVLTTDDYTMAVTFNAGSDSVSIIDAESLAVTEVEVRPNLNTLEMSPDGKWAVLYRDQDGEDYDEDDSVISYNDVSLVDLTNAVHYLKIVGANPQDVQFTEDGRTAVVVSDAYLSILDLSTPDADPVRIRLTEDTVDPPEAEEVLLIPDGSHAFVRQFGAEHLLLVDLAAGTVAPLDVGDSPTDLDLTPDGLSAVAVARGSNELWIYELADLTATPTILNMPDGQVLGSVLISPAASKAMLYSTASGVSAAAAWDLNTDEIVAYTLVKPVSGMSITPDGQTALIFHDKDNGSDVPAASDFYNHYGLTMVELEDFFQAPYLLPAEPTGFASAEEGDVGYFIMDGQPLLEVLDFGGLSYAEVELASDPVFVGVLPESRLAYVNQEHELGRMSFFDPDSSDLVTLTGFELNAAIEHEE